MSETKVINLRDHAAVAAAQADGTFVRIDRQTRWGNPYKVTKGQPREEAIAMFRAYLLDSPELLADVGQLQGKTLACWCAPWGGVTWEAPRVCHGQVLAYYAETDSAARAGADAAGAEVEL